jgi:hypothetical protein
MDCDAATGNARINQIQGPTQGALIWSIYEVLSANIKRPNAGRTDFYRVASGMKRWVVMTA